LNHNIYKSRHSSKTITVHVYKEEMHSEKTLSLGIDPRLHGSDVIAAIVGWSFPDASLPARPELQFVEQ
jgi:hypothetical protein